VFDPFRFDSSFGNNQNRGFDSFFQFCDELLAISFDVYEPSLPNFVVRFEAGERNKNEIHWFSGVDWFRDIPHAGEENLSKRCFPFGRRVFDFR
jgi:hypothetical protein